MSSGWGSSGFGSGTGGVTTERSTFVDNFTLSALDIANKYVLLSSAPPISQRNQTIVHVSGGTTTVYAESFQVTNDDGGTRLSWDGLDLDGLLAEGDQLVVSYPIIVIT